MNFKSMAFGVTVFTLIALPLLSSPRIFHGFDLPSIALYSLTSLLLLLYTLANPDTRHGGMMGNYLKIYFGWLVIAALIAPDPGPAFFGLPHRNQGFFFFAASGFFLFIGSWMQAYKKQLLMAIVLTGALVGGIATLEFWAGLWSDFRRSTATFGNPTMLAPYLILIIPVCLAGLFTVRERWMQWAGYGALFLLLVGTCVTYACGGWGGLLITALLFALFAGKGYLQNPRLVIRTMLVSGLALGLSVVLIQARPGGVRGYPPQRIPTVETSLPAEPNRAIVLNTVWRIFLERPWTGVGLNGVDGIIPKYLTPSLAEGNRMDTDLEWVHHELAHTLATQGVLGLLVYLGLLFLLGKNWWDWMACTRRSMIDAGLWAALFGYFIVIQFSFPWVGYPFMGWLFIGFLGPAVPEPNTIVQPGLSFKLKVALASLCVAAALGYCVRIAGSAWELAYDPVANRKPVHSSRNFKVPMKPKPLTLPRKGV